MANLQILLLFAPETLLHFAGNFAGQNTAVPKLK